MGLTQEEWDGLTPEEQGTRQDEKPQPAGKEPDDQTVSELNKSVKNLKDQLDSLQNEKQGIYRDLKQERELRRQMEATVQELQSRGKVDEFDINKLADDEYLTAGQVKKLIAGLQGNAQNNENAQLQARSRENYANDEERLIEASKTVSDEYPVPYTEAVKEFEQMAKKNPVYWKTVHEESIRSGGKPAEVAYKIALTSKTFLSKIRASTRESLLSELEKEGQIKPRKLPSGGAGKPELNAANLSEEDLLSLSDTQLDELLAKTG